MLSLIRLLLQANRIREISGVATLRNLEEFYIADNGLTSLQGLESNNLQTIEIANNRISDFSGVEHMSNLEEFWANNNTVEDFKQVEKLCPNTALLTVYLEHNPIQKDPQYRRKIKLTLPSLTQIDSTMCK